MSSQSEWSLGGKEAILVFTFTFWCGGIVEWAGQILFRVVVHPEEHQSSVNSFN